MAAGTSGRVFISYRRQETAWPARQLYELLATRFGADKIFKDVDNIQPGEDFVEKIGEAVASCDVLLALIGPQWLDAADETGARRLEDPDDFVRLELTTALTRGVLVIPILVDGARMPPAARLPAELVPLTRRQAVEINPVGFTTDRLLAALTEALNRPPSAASAAGVSPADQPLVKSGTAAPPLPHDSASESRTIAEPAAGGSPLASFPGSAPTVVSPPAQARTASVPADVGAAVEPVEPVPLPQGVVALGAVTLGEARSLWPGPGPVPGPATGSAGRGVLGEESPGEGSSSGSRPVMWPGARPEAGQRQGTVTTGDSGPPEPGQVIGSNPRPQVPYPVVGPVQRPQVPPPGVPPVPPGPAAQGPEPPRPRTPAVRVGLLVGAAVVALALVVAVFVVRPWESAGPAPSGVGSVVPTTGAPTISSTPATTSEPPASPATSAPSPTPTQTPASELRPQIVAHRGGLEVHQFETQQAMEAAALAGYWVETDVRYTSDGVAVLVHDEQATKGLDCGGKSIQVSQTTWSTLRKTCRSKPSASDRKTYEIPRLDATMEGIAAASPTAWVLVEIKTEQTAAQRKAFLGVFARNGLRERAVVTSFNRSWLAAMRKQDAGVPRMLFVSRQQIPAAELKSDGLWGVAVEQSIATKKYVSDLQKMGVRVMVWVVNDARLWQAAVDLHPDLLMTAYPGKFEAWLRAR